MMTTTRRPAPRRGLSLIEVLLALAILVISLAAISQLVDIGTTRGNDARAATRGTRLAQAKMAEVEAGVVDITSVSEGTFEGDDAAWNFTVTPEQDEGGPANLYTVTVKVSRDLQGKPYEIVLTQMLFDPKMIGSAAQAEPPAPPPDPADPAADPATTGM